jgi:hypothetical protein
MPSLPATDVEFAGHARHAALPGAGWYVFAGHGRHATATATKPTALESTSLRFWNEPGAHGAQALSCVPSVPGRHWHCVGAVMPCGSTGWLVAAHGVHARAPAALHAPSQGSWRPPPGQ